MSFSDKLVEKLDNLIGELNQILSRGKLEPAIKYKDLGFLTQKRVMLNPEPEYTGRVIIENAEDLCRFATSSLVILKEYIGESSIPYLEFRRQWESISSENTIDRQDLRKLKGPLESAKKELSEGFLPPYEFRVTSVVYDDLLGQADRNFQRKEDQAAAILAGAILDDGLKRIAKLKGVSPLTGNTIEPISHDLVKAGVIIELERKKISSWAEIHNKAEHEFEEFKKISRKDVEEMLKGIEEFLTKHLS